MANIGGCCALQTAAESKAATENVKQFHLPSHHDPNKNWDTLKSLYYILEMNNALAPVFDAGASSDSIILKWLSMLGYSELYACDIRSRNAQTYKERGIKFSIQDFTRTNYPDNFFQAITAISVIEHGVPLNDFIAEMSRILCPGGVLLVSTDYWSEPVDCSGIYPYGKEMGEMKVFQVHEIETFCKMAREKELFLCSPLNLDTNEKVVRWERVDREYTFAFLAFRKKSGR